jgi:hypothetical protein
VCLNLQETEAYPYISPVTVANTKSAMVRAATLHIPRCAKAHALIRRRSGLYNLEATIMVGLTKQPDEENMDWILMIKTRLDYNGGRAVEATVTNTVHSM